MDFHQFSNGRLSVGIFNESGTPQPFAVAAIVVCYVAQKAMNYVKVARSVRTAGMSEWESSMLVSCLYYDLSVDQMELVTYISVKKESENPGQGTRRKHSSFQSVWSNKQHPRL